MRTTIAKKIEVYLPDGGSSYYVTIEEAKHLTATNQAIWDGSKRIIRRADSRPAGTLRITESGINGPLVVQLT